ncbi:MAG TPA: LytTR family DNA-binding domain-containing protein [Puia sp.]|uniref:LytR/AlgR family response regulator transcription factor n=1 Tax=Puia sp. TaxID=2045100 RepID=UPI002BAC6D83|nr:LytTR family DNA-binding domain-containing protein [Puia sp.]HVU95347.1 LytTR family DNA-binding domain-containing protein [Puia sp.]
MLTCIAVDDEPLALHLLTEYISKVPFLTLVGTCGDAFEAARVLQESSVDLVFMDIQMPGLTGLQFIQSLAKRPMFILVTAYKKFAPEGFDLEVVDYLIKPVGMDRFLKACYKAQELHQLRAGASAAAQPDYIFVNADYSLVKVLFGDIIWVEVSGDYVKFHLRSSNKPLLVRISAKALEAELPGDRFVRIHKSYIVSVSAITAVRKNSVFIGTLELPVGETYREALRQITGKDI